MLRYILILAVLVRGVVCLLPYVMLLAFAIVFMLGQLEKKQKEDNDG